MRKYIYIYKSELMSQLQYLFNLVFGFIGCGIILFIFFNLWHYIYSDSNQIINGYSVDQMIWYVIITEIIWGACMGRTLCRKISNDVRGGNIAYNINKPYNYIGYSLASHLGTATVKGIIYTVLALILGLVMMGNFPTTNVLELVLVLISSILAVVISSLFTIFIGLFSFFIEDSSPFYWLYSKFILVIGVIFPIEYFPNVVQPFLKFSPIYVVSYGPAKLFVNFNINDCISIFVAQFIYILVAYLLCSLVYKKGVRRLNVNGG